jgi:hypothetical protein
MAFCLALEVCLPAVSKEKVCKCRSLPKVSKVSGQWLAFAELLTASEKLKTFRGCARATAGGRICVKFRRSPTSGLPVSLILVCGMTSAASVSTEAWSYSEAVLANTLVFRGLIFSSCVPFSFLVSRFSGQWGHSRNGKGLAAHRSFASPARRSWRASRQSATDG